MFCSSSTTRIDGVLGAMREGLYETAVAARAGYPASGSIPAAQAHHPEAVPVAPF